MLLDIFQTSGRCPTKQTSDAEMSGPRHRERCWILLTSDMTKSKYHWRQPLSHEQVLGVGLNPVLNSMNY